MHFTSSGLLGSFLLSEVISASVVDTAIILRIIKDNQIIYLEHIKSYDTAK